MSDLRKIRTFPALIKYLRDELDWPIESDDFEDLTFDYSPEELGIDAAAAAKIQEIKRLRPLSASQPWGVFFVKFEPKKLPVVALRRILSRVVVKKRASANRDERPAWQMEDILFISNYGEGDSRQLTFAHFSGDQEGSNLPTLRVLGWDGSDTPLRLEREEQLLRERLKWPDDEQDPDAWRDQWRSAFALRHREVITTSKLLATRLAQVARSIRARIRSALKVETGTGPLRRLMAAFQQSLLHDLEEDGFADMYAQTITYGLLSARIASPSREHEGEFALPVTNPFLKEMMETFLRAGSKRGRMGDIDLDFDELGVTEVIDLLDDTKMGDVLRDFGDRNPLEDPVIHFYELFLIEYDATERLQRGVFYTPRPVVAFIVRSVHEALQREFGLDAGLADTTTWGELAARRPDVRIPHGVPASSPFVTVLDPATGTGTFLVETIDIIHRTVTTRWAAEGRSEAEIASLWNEYVPRHLLPRLHGFEILMAPYAIAHVKVGLKLYETGYRFASAERARVFLTNALEPAQAMQVSLGVPALAHEAQAVKAVKTGQHFTVVIGNPPYSNFGQLNKIPWILELLEDYKRELKEKKINLDDDFIKFTRFAQFQIERAGAGVLGFITNNVFIDGLTHRQMRRHMLECFSTLRVIDLHGSAQKAETAPGGGRDENVFDIKQGVAIGIYVRSLRQPAKLQTYDLFGERGEKYDALAMGTPIAAGLVDVAPEPPLFFFKPVKSIKRDEYESGWRIPDAMPFYNSGIQTKRDSLTIHREKRELEGVLADFKQRPAEWLRAKYDLGGDGRDWTISLAKSDVRQEDGRIIQVQYRPLDFRYTYFSGRSKGFLAYPREDVSRAVLSSKLALVTMRQIAGVPDECEVLATSVPVTDRAMASTLGTPYMFPLYKGRQPHEANFSPGFLKSMASAVGSHVLKEPQVLFGYIYGLLHSPTYRKRYADLIRIDFPRVLIPAAEPLYRKLSTLGSDLTELHTGVRPPARMASYSGPTSPTVGKVEWSEDRIRCGSAGEFWPVAKEVWEFRIGGYQVCEKWLKDRKGSSLTKGEVAHYEWIIAVVAETQRAMGRIDEVIEAHGGWPGAFRGTGGPPPGGNRLLTDF